jgi:hypothetical protein
VGDVQHETKPKNGGDLRIFRLILLAMGIQADILDSIHPAQLTLADFMNAFPNDWTEQRVYFGVMIVSVS